MAVPSPFQGVPLTLSLSADPCIFAWVVKTWLFRHLSRVLPLTLSQSADPLSPLGRLMFFSPSHTCGPPSSSLARSTGGPRSHPQRFRSHCRLHPGRAASLLVKVSMFGNASTGTSGLPHLARFPDAQAAALPLPLRMDITSGASTQLILYPAAATPGVQAIQPGSVPLEDNPCVQASPRSRVSPSPDSTQVACVMGF